MSDDGIRDTIYNFIVDYKQAHDGLSPFLQEIAEGCLIGVSTVRYHLLRLEIENKIRWVPRQGIMVTGGQWIPPQS